MGDDYDDGYNKNWGRAEEQHEPQSLNLPMPRLCLKTGTLAPGTDIQIYTNMDSNA
jgi:hypothetical protein